MDLLVLESEDDDPVVKSAVKGIASVTTVTGKGGPQDSRLGRTASNQLGYGFVRAVPRTRKRDPCWIFKRSMMFSGF